MSPQESSTSEERVNDRLEKLERHTLRLSDIKDYLIHLKYARAIDHEEEVQEFLEILDKCSSDVFAVLHDRHAAAQAVVNPAQAPTAAQAPPKAPTSELKPEKLTHDSSMGKQFRAYFDTVGVLRAHAHTLAATCPCMQNRAS